MHHIACRTLLRRFARAFNAEASKSTKRARLHAAKTALGASPRRRLLANSMPLQDTLAEYQAKAKVRREKTDAEAKAARDLGIPPCADQRCAVCTVPGVCEKCKHGSTLVQKPPARVGTPPAFDAGGWEVDDEVPRADWPKVCLPCSTGCRACDNPSPAGCTACYPLYDLGPEGCSASFKSFAMLSAVSVLVLLIAAYLTRLNWNKVQRIRKARASKQAKKQAKKTQ